jgi:signal transduction histidine kinase
LDGEAAVIRLGQHTEQGSAERVLIVAPNGRDANVLRDTLRGAGIGALPCRDVEELPALVRERADVLLLTDEALAPAGTNALLAALTAQPPWSDLPIVILAGSASLAAGQKLARESAISVVRAAGNVTILGRPVRALTLLSTVEASLRARRRQYQLGVSIEREQEARKQAEGALKLKDDFLATVSHELRTPLSAILLWTRLLIEGGLSPKKTARGLGAIAASAQAQSRLIEDLLDASRMIAGKLDLDLRPVDLAAVARAAIDVVRPGAREKQLTIKTALDPAIIVNGDPARLQQVVWNLMSNAVKFTPPDGRICAFVKASDGHAVIEIHDTGSGVSREFLPHMFERFRQADHSCERRHGGLGLGLAISRDLVALHGGRIWADSDGEGLGTVFTIELPLAGKSSDGESGDGS